MTRKKSDFLEPFNDGFSDCIGRGKDSVVCGFKNRVDIVVKWNHDKKIDMTTEEHFSRILYLKNKYEMLKFFLGDFIPKTSFLLGKKNDGGKKKIKEYVIQERVPNIRLCDLTEKQRKDPRFIHNFYLLLQKLKNMYLIINNFNESINYNEGVIDGRLELGGISREVMENDINDFDFSNISGLLKSPNLLVNPDTMRLYCVDFDQGIWNDSKSQSLIIIKLLTENEKDTMEIINKTQKVKV